MSPTMRRALRRAHLRIPLRGELRLPLSDELLDDAVRALGFRHSRPSPECALEALCHLLENSSDQARPTRTTRTMPTNAHS